MKPAITVGVLRSAVQALVKAKALLGAEIARYPTPISGCDAQFNHLLSDRMRLANTLRAIEDQPFVPTSRQPEPAVYQGE